MGGHGISRTRRVNPYAGTASVMLPVAVFTLFCAVGSCVGHVAEVRVRDASALHCARTSDGTDSAIADCYTVRGLAIPADL